MESAGHEPSRRKGIFGRPTEKLLEALLSWVSSLVLFFSTVYAVLEIDFLWIMFGITVLCLYVLPIVATKNVFNALPWEMTLLLTAPMLLHISAGSESLNESVAWWQDLTDLAFAFSIATIGFLLTVELQIFTDIRMNRPFSVFFVIMFTLAVAGFWGVGEFIGDKVWGTDYLGSNRDVMVGFFWSLVGGVVMGVIYYLYLKVTPRKRRETLSFMHMWEVAGWRKG